MKHILLTFKLLSKPQDMKSQNDHFITTVGTKWEEGPQCSKYNIVKEVKEINDKVDSNTKEISDMKKRLNAAEERLYLEHALGLYKMNHFLVN